MPRLKTLEFDPPALVLPQRIVDLLDDADGRIDDFQFEHRDTPVAAFVPSDFVLAYQSLTAIVTRNLAAGRRFVEWGAGVGVVTCLAAELGFDAVGIEIEEDLVEVSRAGGRSRHRRRVCRRQLCASGRGRSVRPVGRL